MRGVFNAAHWRSGAVIPRCVGDAHEIELFEVFGPRVLAMIGRPQTTMLSRSIPITLQRKTARDRVERVRQDRIREHCAPLRRQWRRWANDHLDQLRDHDPELSAGPPENRASDNWRPLIAIADLAGGEWPSRARHAAVLLAGVRNAEDEPTNVTLLADMQKVFDSERHVDDAYLSSEEIIVALKSMEDRPWADWNKGRGISPAQLASRLRDFGDGATRLGTRNTRIGPGPKDVLKKWHRRDFLDAWVRYVPSDPLHPLQVNKSGHEHAISAPLQEDGVAVSKTAVFSMNSGDVAGVAGSSVDLTPIVEKEVRYGRI